jgi:hypothetical protein
MKNSSIPEDRRAPSKYRKYLQTVLVGIALCCMSIVVYRAQTRERGERPMPWDDPLDPVAVTVGEVALGERDVLLVIHDEGHGGWQFYDGDDVSQRKPFIIPKADLLNIDPSLNEVIDLPVGWRAERRSKYHPWNKSRSYQQRD